MFACKKNVAKELGIMMRNALSCLSGEPQVDCFRFQGLDGITYLQFMFQRHGAFHHKNSVVVCCPAPQSQLLKVLRSSPEALPAGPALVDMCSHRELPDLLGRCKIICGGTLSHCDYMLSS